MCRDAEVRFQEWSHDHVGLVEDFPFDAFGDHALWFELVGCGIGRCRAWCAAKIVES